MVSGKQKLLQRSCLAKSPRGPLALLYNFGCFLSMNTKISIFTEQNQKCIIEGGKSGQEIVKVQKEDIEMLDKKVVELLNQQVNKEFYSAYLYLDFSNYYYDEGLDGFGNWYRIQAQEERDHAMLMLQYLQNNGEKVVLEAIDKPSVEITDAKSVLEAGLKHEQYVTGLIHTIYEAAHSVKDFRTMQFLDWFVKEQGEEENNAETLVKKFELFGDDPKSLYMLDNELGARVYSAPSLTL